MNSISKILGSSKLIEDLRIIKEPIEIKVLVDETIINLTQKKNDIDQKIDQKIKEIKAKKEKEEKCNKFISSFFKTSGNGIFLLIN